MKKHHKFEIGHLWSLLKQTYKEWDKDDPFRNSAVIAYYSIFSLPGLLIIIITLAGWFFGQEAVQGQLSSQMGEAMGEDAAKQIESIIANARVKENSTIATIIGIATLVFGATGVFVQLQQTLNQMWEVKANTDGGFKEIIKDRVFSFGLILVIGFLLLMFMILTSALNILSDWIMTKLPDYTIYLFRALTLVLSFGVVTLLFAAMYKILPDAKIRWKDVWVGAMVTAALFAIGKFLLGLYFAFADPASSYGAAGSLILVMLWISYSSLIFFFGAEFTQVYANTYGAHIEPSSHAVRAPRKDKNKEDSHRGNDVSNRPERKAPVPPQVNRATQEKARTSTSNGTAYIIDHSNNNKG